MRLADLTVVRELGRGAFGRVVLARSPAGAEVAAKLVPAADEGAVARLRREHGALTRVRHEGVVCALDLVESDETAALLMEHVDGEPWLAHVRGDLPPRGEAAVRRNLPMAFGIELTEEGVSDYRRCTEAGLERLEAALPRLVEAVRAIHGAGLLHLDLSPDNVRVTGEGRVVVLDLGLAVEADAAGVAARVPDGLVGMAPYLAPELGDRPPSRASDWYSVGVLVFEALTGAVPFEGTGADVLARKRTLSPPAPSELVDAPIPADLEARCLRWLDPVPGAR